MNLWDLPARDPKRGMLTVMAKNQNPDLIADEAK